MHMVRWQENIKNTTQGKYLDNSQLSGNFWYFWSELVKMLVICGPFCKGVRLYK